MIFLGMWFGGAVASAIPQWELVPITPACRADVFCVREDIASSVIHAGIVDRLVKMTDRAARGKGRVQLAFMSFSEPTLFAALCRAGRNGLEIVGFFDSQVGPPKGMGYRLTQECQGPDGGNVRMYYMGMSKSGRGGWRLHHNKFFIAVYGPLDVEMAFGSANISSNGLSVNFENWNFVKGPARLPFIRDHLCAAGAMRAARDAGNLEDDPVRFRRDLEACVTHPVASSNGDEVLALSLIHI
jgi:hypothetical protein